MEGEPGGDQRCDDQEKADISKAAVHVFKVRDLHLAGMLALFILLGRGGAGRRHRGIIAHACCRGAMRSGQVIRRALEFPELRVNSRF